MNIFKIYKITFFIILAELSLNLSLQKLTVNTKAKILYTKTKCAHITYEWEKV